MIHLLLHAAVPLLIAVVVFPTAWRFAWLTMMAAMLIDIDHLWAEPIYDPERCSIGLHPLHTGYAALGYSTLLVADRTRLLGIGLAVHLGLDAVDCQMTNGVWWV